MTSARTLGLVIAAMLLLTPVHAAAQNQRPIRQRDVPATQAEDVYQLVETLRPDWLWTGGDPRYAASRGKVRVWVGDTQVGGLESLRGLPVANLYSVRLVGRRVARARDPRLDPEVVGALLVRYEDGPPPPRRFEVTGGIGYRSLLESRARKSFADAGLHRVRRPHYWTESLDHPVTVFAAGALRLGGRAGVSANILHTGGHNVRGFPPDAPAMGVINRFSTTDLAAEAFAGSRIFRVGAGPAVRLLRYTQTMGNCECLEPESGTELVVGGAADVSVIVPPTGPMHLQLIFAGRWFPSHAIPASRGAPDTELGGFTTYLTIAAGFGL